MEEPYSSVGFVWTDTVEATRALVLVSGLHLCDEGADRWLVESIYEHGAWLSDATHLVHSNAALHQHQALFVLGSAFNKRDWAAMARDRMTALFEESYDEQGINWEGAIGHHKSNLIRWEQAFRRLDLEGVPRPSSAIRLSLACLELAHATRPDGTLEVIGDASVSGPGGLSSPELDYVKSQGSTGHPPDALTKIYDRGYIFGRSGWGDHERSFRDETFYALKFGKANQLHGHQDGGALTLHSGGNSWLTDTGTSADMQGEIRDYFVSRLGHNVVHIHDRTYNQTADVLLTRSSTSAAIDDFAFSDTGYDGVEIRRRVVYCRGGDFFLVVDTVLSREEIEASQRWHLNAGTVVEPTAGGFRLEQGNSAAWIQWRGNMPALSAREGCETPIDGRMPDEGLARHASPVISARQKGTRFRFITVIASPQSGQFDLKRLTAADGRINLSAVIGRYQFNLAVEEHTATVSLGEEIDRAPSGIRTAWLRTMELCRLAEVDWKAPRPTGHGFSSPYWGTVKTWIRQQPASRAARLEVLSILLGLLLDERDSSGGDQGLRAAVVDVMGPDLCLEVGLSTATLGLLREPLIAWDDLGRLHSPMYARSITTIDSPEDMVLAPDRRSEIFSANVGGLVLPFIVGRGSSDLLSVRFHGAINRNKTTLPFFQGLTAETTGEDNFAIFQDPSLDLNTAVTLAWYLGDGQADIHHYMAECIARLQAELDLKQVLLSGSSGGGFTALQVASYLPEAVALVFNPQTNVRAYFPNSAQAALASCLKETIGDPPSREEITSVVTKYARARVLPKVVYVQNVGDKHHVVKHRDPFRRMLDTEHPNDKDRVSFIDVDWGQGHVSPTSLLQQSFREHAISLFGR